MSPEETTVSLGTLNLKVGQILSVKEHPNAEKLFIEEIDVGEEEPRQIVSGLKDHYEMGALEEKKVIVVANLKPAKLRGEISQGMILAAEDEHGVVGLITTDASIGSSIVSEEEKADNLETITIETFFSLSMEVSEQGPLVNGKPVSAEDGTLEVDKDIIGKIR